MKNIEIVKALQGIENVISFETENKTSILNVKGEFALYKNRKLVSRGIKLDVALAPLLKANAILNARASPIIKHATSKFKFLIF